MTISFMQNDIKVPEPNISNGSSDNKTENKKEALRKAPLRQYERPNVGVLSVPDISKTPLSDTYSKKREDNPRVKYKFTPNKIYKKFKMNNLISLSILSMGLVAFFTKGKK